MPYKLPERERDYQRDYQRKWRKDNPERWGQIVSAQNKRLIAKIGIEAFRKQRNEKSKAWRLANPERTRFIAKKARQKRLPQEMANRRLNKYGLTNDDFNALIATQQNKCAICAVSFAERKPHVDHCHKSKRVRGLLCSLCNRGLGHFRDNHLFLIGAAAYLKAHA